MSARKSRHQLMQALVRGSTIYLGDPDVAHVDTELGELGRCLRLQPPKRQRLLQVMHASRALDTLLSSILKSHGVQPAHGIGKMLHQLKGLPPAAQGYLDHKTSTAFVSAIAHKRNRYAHRANAFPTSNQEVDRLVAEIHACMAMIL
ncbi:hypothetical protein [Novosphingobium aerophilum]|uniref:hypothetical protein n=1 Tax=Novosphingobium aerophilum TaxID=2839843 RepID=UPI001BE463E6|nr:hypothetical protein [Novosphingobium aerophilum]